MAEGSITCRYVFTTKEFVRAFRCFYRNVPGIWWLLVPFALVWVVGLLQDAGVIFTNPGQPPLSTRTIIFGVLSNLIELFLLIGFVVFLTAWTFRRTPNYNQDMEYVLGSEGVSLKNAVMELKVPWEAIPRVVEGHWGFALCLKGKWSIHWLPKSGFADPGAVDACRILLRQHVPDTKKLFAAVRA